MANLATFRNTETKEAPDLQAQTGIAAGVIAYPGLMNFVNAAGHYDPDNAVRVIGLVYAQAQPLESFDNTSGVAGAKRFNHAVNCKAPWDAHATHPPTVADIGKPAYASDNHTVSRLSADGIYCGIIRDFDGDQVLVYMTADEDPSQGRMAAAQTVAAADELIFQQQKDVFPLIGDGAPVTLTADFPDVEDGRLIELVGAHATNVVTITTGINTLLAGGADCPLALGSRLVLRGDATADAWCEVSRSLNA